MQVRVYPLNSTIIFNYKDYFEVTNFDCLSQAFALIDEKTKQYDVKASIEFSRTGLLPLQEIEEKLCYTNKNWLDEEYLDIRDFQPTGDRWIADMIADWFYRVYFLKERFVYRQFQWVGDYNNNLDGSVKSLEKILSFVGGQVGVGVKVNDYYYIVGYNIDFAKKTHIGFIGIKAKQLEELKLRRNLTPLYMYEVNHELKNIEFHSYHELEQ